MATDKNSRRVPVEKAATREEIEVAFSALTDAQLLRLKKFAAYRVTGLGHSALGRKGEDLLQEAFISLLSGERRWNKEKVDMYGLLRGAIRSISSHWGEQANPDSPDEAKLESEFLRENAEGKTRNTLARKAASIGNPDSGPASKDKRLQELEEHFKGDEEVLLILEGIKEGMTGPQMVSDLGISEQKYKAADKRLRRKIADMSSKGRLNG